MLAGLFGHKDAFAAQKELLAIVEVKTIFDVGAYIGTVTEKYTKLFPQAHIHSFEPVLLPYGQICLKFQSNSLVKPVNCALSDKEGSAVFCVNQASYTSSLLQAVPDAGKWIDNPPDIQNSYKTVVPVTTIDAYCERNTIDNIQILKMDAQGGELDILKGASGMLKRQAIELIYTEVLFVPLYEGQGSFHDISQFLLDYRYALLSFYNISRSHGKVKWADAIFIKSDNRVC